MIPPTAAAHIAPGAPRRTTIGHRRELPAPLIVAALVALLIGLAAPAAVEAQAPADSLAGSWSFDRRLSQFPREFGFSADFVPPRDDSADPGGRRRGTPVPALRPQGDSYEDAQRRQQLTDEVRNPPSSLTITDTGDRVVFDAGQGNTRELHPTGRPEILRLGNVPLLTTTIREDGKLVVNYLVAELRQLRYTYTRLDGPPRIQVDVQFIERGTPGDTVRLVYVPPAPAVPATTGAAGRGDGGGGLPATGATPPAGAPPSSMPRAGSEFAGLTRLGIVVEEPGQQAVSCGLTKTALEAAAAKPFADAGLRVSTNSDEDTYVHVTVMTSTLPTGMCITRYDWSIYSMTDATLSYQQRPLLVQVLLAHKGGLTGSMPSSHGADVTRGLTDGFTQIAGIIRDANR